MKPSNKHLKVLGVREEPLIGDLECVKFTPEEKEVTKEGLLDGKPITPPMEQDKLLEPNENLLPQAHPAYKVNRIKGKSYLDQLAESVG